VAHLSPLATTHLIEGDFMAPVRFEQPPSGRHAGQWEVGAARIKFCCVDQHFLCRGLPRFACKDVLMHGYKQSLERRLIQ
jgi:hypothetical protein